MMRSAKMAPSAAPVDRHVSGCRPPSSPVAATSSRSGMPRGQLESRRRLGGRHLDDEVGEQAAQAPAGGAAGEAPVVFEGFVSGRNREFLVEYASARVAERLAQLGLGPGGAA